MTDREKKTLYAYIRRPAINALIMTVFDIVDSIVYIPVLILQIMTNTFSCCCIVR